LGLVRRPGKDARPVSYDRISESEGVIVMIKCFVDDSAAIRNQMGFTF
jgi:hypothetical protein